MEVSTGGLSCPEKERRSQDLGFEGVFGSHKYSRSLLETQTLLAGLKSSSVLSPILFSTSSSSSSSEGTFDTYPSVQRT